MLFTDHDRKTAPSTGPVGYSLPISPSGQASMLTPPPWHFSGEVIMVEYRVDPAAAERFLPPGLTLGADPGAAAAVFAEWQWCSGSEDELAEPALNQFAEFLILLGCEYRGAPMARCPFAWVDQPVPMVRGWVQGMPKQFGVVHQSRPTAVGRGGPRLAPGGRFHGTLSVNGRRAVETAVTLHGRTEHEPLLHTVPLAHTLMFPDWASTGAGRPTLVASEVTDVEFSGIWKGAAELKFVDVVGADFNELSPIETGEGYVFSYAETLCNGRAL
ncbi:enduracididine biosynthesis enzyme MppR [Sphaerisporangium sp. NPDC051011]|uniref:enduracididine biosynthesis enzyme MppR n=1 Tax=Sphaerisporangium sp. NPDC051011 TaxID=3155792 RepID=UPI0034089035